MTKIRTLQIYRGTTAQNDAYTGSVGELTMDTTTNELRLHDGSTAGGHVIGSGGGSGYHPDLFDVKWADHICNDVQWLRADTYSWQSGAVYQAAYQHLADDIDGKTLQSETISGTTIQFYLADDGHKICPASEESNVSAIYNSTGVAWYYIIDTANTRFKLPRTQFAFTGIRNGVGEFVEAGLPNITGWFTADNAGFANNSAGGAFNNLTNTAKNRTTGSNASYPSVGFDASRCSSIYGNSTTVQPKATEMYLYFYVGNFTQTAIENTAGLNAELFNEKADITAIPDLVEPIITPDYDNSTTITNGTTYLADKTYLAILGSGSGSQAHVDISKNSDMSSPITIVQIYITSSGNIYFVSTGIIPKGWYYKATNGSTKTVPIG